MLRFKWLGMEWELSFPFFAVITLSLLLDRTGTGACGMLAIAVHELGHLLGYRLMKERPERICFSVEGFRLFSLRRYLPLRKELWILCAGSGMNLLVFGVLLPFSSGSENLLRLACGQLLVGLFNLLPIGILDGGRILARLLEEKLEDRAAFRMSGLLSWLTLLPLLGGAGWLFVRSQNLALAVSAAFLLAAQLQKEKDG